ncbi:MAG: RDD family protein [Aphanothece sp. CMT-3BRIN-NPC111]|nr:RDD family protein [Aphanothece sp. CMT-3BRIN-NPC111]
MTTELAYTGRPKVPIQRRAAAFMIDFVSVWLVTLLLGGNTLSQLLVFIVAWLGMRVVLVAKNQGQSLGRWALDMKVIDAKFGKTPGLLELSKREGLTGFGSILALLGLSIGLANSISLLLLSAPLAVDYGVALADSRSQQTLHDRLARTAVVATHRGFSLDLRIKKLLAQATRRLKQ